MQEATGRSESGIFLYTNTNKCYKIFITKTSNKDFLKK